MNTRNRFVILVLCGALLAAAGCSGNSTNSGQTPAAPAGSSVGVQPTAAPSAAAIQASPSTPTPEAPSPTVAAATVPATNGTPTSINPFNSLALIVTSLNAVKSFRAKVTVSPAPAGTNGESTLEWALPDKFHVIAGTGEFIRIGNTIYIKIGPNKWTNGSAQSVPLMQDPRTQIAQLISAGAVTLSGPDTLDGKPMLVYQINPSKIGVQGTVSGKLWVGATDGLPYQEIAVLQGGTQTTIVFYDYNADIQINPPTQ